MGQARLRAYIYLLIVALIWGIAGPVIKLTLVGLSPDIFLLYRFFISAVLALIIFMFRPFRFPKDKKILGFLILYAILNSTISLGLLFWGTDKTSLIDMSLISLFAPLLSILAGYIFLKEHITLREKVGILTAFVGSLIILIEPIVKFDGPGAFIGNLLIFGSLIAGVTAGLLLKKMLREDIDAVGLANFSFIVGFVTLLPIVLFLYSPFEIWNLIISNPSNGGISPAYHAGVWYMAVFSGTVAYALLNMGYKTIELSEAALFSYLYPIFSAILAILFLGDKLTLPAAIGSVVTFAGVFIAEVKKKRYT